MPRDAISVERNLSPWCFMRTAIRASLWLILSGLVFVGGPTPATPPSSEALAQSDALPQVRLRKLHLVRPDLIR